MEYAIFSCIESRINNSRNYYSRFKIGPFSNNKAIIYANTLRRILLSDVTNINIIGVTIIGAVHEYSSIFGVKESVLDILLNLKQIILIKDNNIFSYKSFFGYLYATGPLLVKSNHIILPSQIYCVDSNQYIATLTTKSALLMKLKLSNYKEITNCFENENYWNSLLDNYNLHFIKNRKFLFSLDSNFSCVNKVNYFLSSFDNLEKYSDFIILEVWTNGSSSPRLAIQNSIKNFIDLLFSMYDISLSKNKICERVSFLENYVLSISNKMNFFKQFFFSIYNNMLYYNSELFNNLNFSCFLIEDLKLSIQVKTILRKFKFITVGDICKVSKYSLFKDYGFSKKQISDIEKCLNNYNVFLKK